MREIEVIDSELRLLVVYATWSASKKTRRPSAAWVDELLDSRSQFARATLSNMAFNVLRHRNRP